MKSKHFLILGNLKKRAQLTAFMLIGLFLLAVFALVYFGSSQIQNQQAQQQADKIFNQVLETTALKFYISRCTDRALTSGIDILSKQGGIIFPSQMGSLINYSQKVYTYKDISTNKTYIVNYGILREDTPVPQWPCKIGFPNYDIGPAFCFYSSFNKDFNSMNFGINNLPRLCKDRFGGCSVAEGWSPTFSVQAQLESYISQYVDKCVDFSSIMSLNETYDVMKGNISTRVLFSDRDITATIDFPIQILAKAGQPILRFIDFQSSVSTRFKVLYSIARDLVARDTTSPGATNFSMGVAFGEILRNRFAEADPGIQLEAVRNFNFYDTFMRVIDTTATPGKELVLQFFIENRPPVLNYVAQYNGFSLTKPYESNCGVYDVVQTENNYLNISLSSFDTDGENVTYGFSGWLFDYNETNSVFGKGNDGCPVIQATQSKISIPQWSMENKNSTLLTFVTDNETGPHNITVKVCDQQYCDFQEVRILIDDIMKLIVNKTNPYGTDTFSIEDPYNLTASVQKIYLASGITSNIFTWNITNISNHNLVYSIEAAPQVISLPPGNYDILSIKNKYKQAGFTFPSLGYIVNATAPASGAKSGDIIQAHACVNYSNPSNPPYPYNNSDPFFSNHACCSILSTLLGTTTSCFASATYGSYISFNTTKYNTTYDSTPAVQTRPFQSKQTFTGFDADIPSPISSISIFSQGIVYNNSNDIFKRNFTRLCDGTRGNICVGDVVESYTIAAKCPDKKLGDLANGEIASCHGPDPSILKHNTESLAQPACTSYDGYTFESLVGARTDIICNVQAKCISSDNNANGFSSLPGHFLCNATCSSQYGCAKTTQQLCHNCYNDEICSEAGSAVTYKSYSGCTNSCSLQASASIQDACTGLVFTNYSCRAGITDYNYNNPVPYFTDTKDCALAVTPADKPTGSTICTDYTPSCSAAGGCSQIGPNSHQDRFRVLNTTSGKYYNETYVASGTVCFRIITEEP